MTPAEVLELARKHGAPSKADNPLGQWWELDLAELSALIAEVEARTLERTAAICDDMDYGSGDLAASIRSLKPRTDPTTLKPRTGPATLQKGDLVIAATGNVLKLTFGKKQDVYDAYDFLKSLIVGDAP